MDPVLPVYFLAHGSEERERNTDSSFVCSCVNFRMARVYVYESPSGYKGFEKLGIFPCFVPCVVCSWAVD